MGVTDTQSYSHVIRNVFFDAVSADPFFASYTCRKNKMLVARPEYLPYLGVYVLEETMLPDGDGNAGEVRFIHALRIGFSVLMANNDQDALEAQLDAACWRIMNRLWLDEYIMNLLDTMNPNTGKQNPDNTRIESIERGVRRYVWGNSAFNNETPVGEVQYDITCRHRTYWSPVIPDDLLTIEMQTGIKPGDTQDEMGQRQQLHAVYQFDPSSFSAKREFKQRSKGYGR
ncbi:hypothetical protein NLM33_18755 [Bradyrhizobium sp. CCGUVB1N3]|uniref:hypothetical protein n=1 Tax=Bradyrhizobium sp. CCGUVB1N3 TaxID=2949629 RepID=UPI0020B417DA|nr:hypothetical protein [Bradyrhizobium sp. CCGUVB1N3]MCP3471419.1 hypothetical protein [Bradyrhizobium sp. CCGUVB1N3]MCP3472359.1 hypothetical protein [Bradyrhizobium sp. CCGUVB1N3]